MAAARNSAQWTFPLNPGFPPSDQSLRQTHINAWPGNALKEKLRSRIPGYEHVLEYPKGTEHFKYFDSIPHPERYSQELLDIYSLRPKEDLNPDVRLQEMEFERVKNLLAPYLSEKNRQIMRLPAAIRELMANNDNKDANTAWEHLIRCFYNFFTTPVDKDIPVDTMWIDYTFATNYRIGKDAQEDLTNNLFNEKATEKLIEKLRIAGAFGTENKDFYFWNTPHKYWSDMSYQARSVLHYIKLSQLLDISSLDRLEANIGTIIKMIDSMWNEKGLPPQYKALGDFTINALPEGTVIPKGNGFYDICVNDMYYFVNDSFNFEGEEYLDSWDLNYKTDKPILIVPYSPIAVFNSDFRDYQRHGYGRYFPVLSRLHKVDNFVPKCLRNIHVK